MTTQREERSATRRKQVIDLEWHLGAFAVMTVFFWVLDATIGQSGIQWAFWITLFWGLALAFHVVAVVVQRPR